MPLDISFMPWFAWIAIVGIIVGGAVAVVTKRSEHNDTTVKALEQNTAVNEALIARLEGIDGRLARLEKTLDDIPS
jgi:hypothetical protein